MICVFPLMPVRRSWQIVSGERLLLCSSVLVSFCHLLPAQYCMRLARGGCYMPFRERFKHLLAKRWAGRETSDDTHLRGGAVISSHLGVDSTKLGEKVPALGLSLDKHRLSASARQLCFGGWGVQRAEGSTTSQRTGLSFILSIQMKPGLQLD